jgi:4-carboxymuconolactone decarboxylase
MGEYLTERGAQTAVELFGPGGDVAYEAKRKELAESVDSEWAHLLADFVTNGMYSRNILATATRELCAVAALTVLQRTEELTVHLRFALRTNPTVEVREVVLQMGVYGGIPVALSTLKLFDSVLAEEEFAEKRSELDG